MYTAISSSSDLSVKVRYKQYHLQQRRYYEALDEHWGLENLKRTRNWTAPYLVAFPPLSIPYPQGLPTFIKFCSRKALKTVAISTVENKFIDTGGIAISSCTYIGICGCVQFLLLTEWKFLPVTTADRLILQKLLAEKVFYQTIETPYLLTLQLGKEQKPEVLFKGESN